MLFLPRTSMSWLESQHALEGECVSGVSMYHFPTFLTGTRVDPHERRKTEFQIDKISIL